MAWSIFREGGGDNVAVAWAQQFLTRLGVPVTPGNTEFVYQWEKSEGGGGKFNPLNTGGVYNHPELTTTGEQYGGGANDFASWDAGLTGSVINVETPGPDNYPAIVSALRRNDPAGARQALWSSGWAASHYGYGSNWSRATLPGNSGPVIDFSGPDFASSANAVSTAQGGVPDTCLWGFGSTSSTPAPSLKDINPNLPNIGPFQKFNGTVPGNGGICIISKTTARATVGAGLLLIGGLMATIGVLALMKSVSDRTGIVKILTNVPLAGRGVRKLT